ncbi:MAG TPA: hypothetical protein DCZ69_06125, partial [Syntrophobacteraceae bacterium]|nr:hypothetical protein [Syntrophobacteraceae bacterium]
LKIMGAWGTSPDVVAAMCLVGAVFSLATGIFLLRGNRLGRQAYLAGTPLLMIVAFFLYHFRFVQIYVESLLVYVVFALLLTRRAANRFFLANSTSGFSATRSSKDIVATSVAFSGRRLFAVLLLIPGGFLLTTWLMMLLRMSQSFSAFISGSIVFLVLVSAFVVPSILLWDRKQWALLLGVLLTCVGALLLLIAGAEVVVKSVPEFQGEFAKLDPTNLNQMVIGFLISGLTALGCGISLILYHRTGRLKSTSISPFP